jgi:hypothetical protein
MTLLQGLIGHAWAHEGHKERYDDLADKEDAAYQVGVFVCWMVRGCKTWVRGCEPGGYRVCVTGCKTTWLTRRTRPTRWAGGVGGSLGSLIFCVTACTSKTPA